MWQETSAHRTMQKGSERMARDLRPAQIFRDGLAAGVDLELGVDVLHIHADGLDAERQLLGDLLVGAPPG